MCSVRGNVSNPQYRPYQAARISRQSAHEGGKVVRPAHWPPLPALDIFPVLIAVSGWVVGRIKTIKNTNDPIRN
jgi:hypothetical protein